MMKRGPSTYECDRCGNSFLTQAVRDHHILKGICTNRPAYRCFRCNLTFLSVDVLNDHIKSNHESNMIRCTGCNHSFGTTTLYNSHECIPPRPTESFMCQYCMY